MISCSDLRAAWALVVEGIATNIRASAKPAPSELAQFASHVRASTIAGGGSGTVGTRLGGLFEFFCREHLDAHMIREHHLAILLSARKTWVCIFAA